MWMDKNFPSIHWMWKSAKMDKVPGNSRESYLKERVLKVNHTFE